MNIKKRLFICLFCLIFIFTSILISSVNATAQKSIPVPFEGNTDYASGIVSLSNDLWGVDADTYVDFQPGKKSFCWSYFNGPFFVNGINLNGKHKVLYSVDTNLTKSSGRFDIIFRGNSVADYYAVYLLSNNVSLYHYVRGGGDDIIIASSSVAYKRKANGDAHIDLEIVNGKVSCWVDGTLYFDEYKFDDEESPIVMGFNAVNLEQNKDTATVSNYSLRYIEDEDSFFPMPVCPAENQNLINDSNAIIFPFGNDGNYNAATKTVTLIGPSSGGSGLLNNISFSVDRDYVVRGKLQVPKEGTISRLLIAGDSAAQQTSVYFWDNYLSVFGLTQYIETTVYVSDTPFKHENNGALEFVVLVANDTISIWIDGKLCVEEAYCPMFYPKSNIGFSITGLQGSETAVFSELAVFFRDTDTEYYDKLLGAIPELSLSNYRQLSSDIPAIRQKINHYVNNGGKTSDLSNYQRLVDTERNLKQYDNNLMVQDLMYIEDCISDFPAITPENYLDQLTISEEYTLKYAGEQIEWLLSEYPELSVDDISNYRRYKKALEIANNQGVSPNLFDKCTGVSPVPGYGGHTDYYPDENKMTVSGTSFFSADNVSINTDETYVFEMDITNEKTSDIKGNTRVAFKGTSAADFLYLNITGKTVVLYDPVNMIEQHLIAEGTFERSPGVSYHLKVITGPGFVTVLINDKLIINNAVVDLRYTGNFFSLHSYANASAIFENIDLHYYDGEPIVFEGETTGDNLILTANRLRGTELGLGFFGKFETNNNTLNVLGSGVGGWFDGVELDNSKPILISADITVNSDDGIVQFLISGKDSLTGACVGVSTKRIMLTEMESGCTTETIQSVYYPRKAKKVFKLQILLEQDKASAFIDGECYFRNESIIGDVLGNTFGAFTEKMSDTAKIADIDLHYASMNELEEFQRLKDSMPEHIEPTLEEKEDNDIDDYDDISDMSDLDDYSEDTDIDDAYEEDEFDDESDATRSNLTKKYKVITKQYITIDAAYYWKLGLIIGGCVLLLAGGVFAFVFLRKNKKQRIDEG